MTDAERALDAGALELGIELTARQRQQLLDLVRELGQWNQRFNLTAINDPVDVIRKHVLDSLSIHRYISGSTVADVGSGAGFPGVPLAIVETGRHVTLIEATGKKAQFLEQVRVKLGLDSVSVVKARAEALESEARFDTVISRALGKLDEFIRVAGHLVAPGGKLLAMKGQFPDEELKKLPRDWEAAAVHRLTVPGLDAQRHLVELRPRHAPRSLPRH